MHRRIVPGGILALSLAVVLLAATTSTASANFLAPWDCPPPTTPTLEQALAPGGEVVNDPEGCLDSQLHPRVDGVFATCITPCSSRFDFGDRQVGTTSPAQRFALVLGDVPRDGQGNPVPGFETITPSISVSGDYAQTNNCSTMSLADPQKSPVCIITVTFAPTGEGPRRGTLSTGTHAATGATGPTVELSGRGVTTPTPPALPLLLSADVSAEPFFSRAAANSTRTLPKKVTIRAITNNDSTLVANGDVKKTTKRLAAGEETRFKARLKHRKQLERRFVKRDKVGVKFKFKATDEFGQTATDESNTKFCRKVIPSDPFCDRH